MKENTREISILKQRILQFLDSKGISKYECYKNTGITNGVLSQSNGMSEDNILRFLSYYNAISSDWLLFGRGSMLRGVQEQSLHQSMTQSSSPTEDSVIYKMYQDQLKVAQEEKVDNKSLCKENGRIEERLRILEAKLQEYESQLGASKENAKGLDHAKNASIKKSSLRNNPNADSAIVP